MSFQLSIDDFDPLVLYADATQWTTPNPQDNPTWWNASAESTSLPWHQATYHHTTANGAKASVNFTGSALAIYGATGPGEAKYAVTVDGNRTELAVTNGTNERVELYRGQVSYGDHAAVVENLGAGLLLDLFVVDMVLGAEGATMTNTTLDDRAPEMKYSGQWTQQTGPNFWNQTSTYTSGPGNAVEFSFQGSAVFVYGDQVNDHGQFAVALNGSDVATLNGRSGCGGGFAKYCEKLHGLAFFAGSLPQGTHTVKITNGGPGEGNKTFFDFDYVDYTVPSAYAAANATVSAGSGGNSTGQSTSGGSGASSVPSASNKPSGAEATGLGSGILLGVLGAWALKKLLH